MEFPHIDCHTTSLHYAQLIKRNKVIAFARNSIGSRSRGCGYGDRTIHAERAVVKRLGDVSQLRGCTMVVVRVNKLGELQPSEPCADCKLFLFKCMNEYGLRKVVYS
jgi:cytidine deaminase